MNRARRFSAKATTPPVPVPPPPPPPLYERSVAESIRIRHLATRTSVAFRGFAQTITGVVGSIAALPSLYERSVAESITFTGQASTLKTFIRTVLRDIILRNLPLILTISLIIIIAIALYSIHTRRLKICELRFKLKLKISKLRFKISELICELKLKISKLISKLKLKISRLKSF